MKFLEKFLFLLALFSFASASMILFSEEMKSNKKNEDKVEKTEVSLKNNNNDLIVYSEEIDKAIEKYFETVENNPEIHEEEKRIFEHAEDDDSNDSSKITLDSSENEKDVKLINGARNVIHTVKNGESLWRIAQKYDIPVYTIVSANPEISTKIIQPGELINVPEKTGLYYKVKRGDSLSKIALKYKISEKNIILSNGIKNHKILTGAKIFLPDAKPLPKKHYVKKLMFRWPLAVKGRITSRYGKRNHPLNGKKQFHTGLDIAAPRGSAIVAVGKGIVVFSGDGGSYGKMIILKHKNNYFSVYAHASKIKVKKGQYIKKGQVIGNVGKSGLTTGNHLHFEIKKSKRNINPESALRLKTQVPVYL